MEDNNKLHYGLSLRLYFEEKAFGPGMVALLRAVEKTGSLQRAAHSMNMAYSKAWKMLRVAEKEWGFLLTDRETGGRDGGGSTLTPQAKELMEAYLSFRRDAEAELDRLFETYFSDEWLNHMREMGGNEKNEGGNRILQGRRLYGQAGAGGTGPCVKSAAQNKGSQSDDRI